jgi:methylenetetrahydrofolate--tRNA-(uracil-5-)-methyltransferase
MQFRARELLYFAGQITGIEGYVGNVATGLVAAINLARKLQGKSEWILPKDTMLGALCHYITHTEPKHFQPMKANFGIMPELDEKIKSKQGRKQAYAERAIEKMHQSIQELDDTTIVNLLELDSTKDM